MLASALGFASAVTGVRPPEVIFTGMKMLGEPMLPLMLFALGARLTQLRREDIPRGLLGALARPLVGLAIALPLCNLLGLQGMARGQLLLFAALPPAVMQFMLAERYGQEPQRVAAMILLGNALAVLFVPMALALGL
jgi:malate permease and related proteins